jgi:hypothetical protein
MIGQSWKTNGQESTSGFLVFRCPLLAWEKSDETYLPVHPIFPGFAINTLFYAAILWVLFAFLGTVRRWRRIRRGQCVKCGYDLRGRPPGDGASSTVCPECGAVQKQKAETQKAETAA